MVTVRTKELSDHQVRILSLFRGDSSFERSDYRVYNVDGVQVIKKIKRKTMNDFWIMQGWYGLKDGKIEFTKAQWKHRPKVRADAIRFLVNEVLGCDPRILTDPLFTENRLKGLFIGHFHSSPYEAVSFAFPELGIKPWEMKIIPHGFYEAKENRVAITNWVVEKKLRERRMANSPKRKRLRSELIKMDSYDFEEYGQMGLINRWYGGSIYAAISEAYPELGIRPWEMVKAPNNTFKPKEQRREAVIWLMKKVGKTQYELQRKDFDNNGLGSMLFHYYKSSPYRCVSELFPELNIQPWEMKHRPWKIFTIHENRVGAIGAMVKDIEDSGRNVITVTNDDLKKYGLWDLVRSRYRNDYILALKETGFIIEEQEKTMRLKISSET